MSSSFGRAAEVMARYVAFRKGHADDRQDDDGNSSGAHAGSGSCSAPMPYSAWFGPKPSMNDRFPSATV